MLVSLYLSAKILVLLLSQLNAFDKFLLTINKLKLIKYELKKKLFIIILKKQIIYPNLFYYVNLQSSIKSNSFLSPKCANQKKKKGKPLLKGKILSIYLKKIIFFLFFLNPRHFLTLIHTHTYIYKNQPMKSNLLND